MLLNGRPKWLLLAAAALFPVCFVGLFLLQVRAQPQASDAPAGPPSSSDGLQASLERESSPGGLRAARSPATTASGAVPQAHSPQGLQFELAPLRKGQVMRLLEIAQNDDALNDHMFAKVGDSMTVSRSYLRCFAREVTEWGDFESLRATAEHFRQPNESGHRSFLRVSEAARVGWSVRSAISGRPSPVRRELRALRPRFATVMFGTNDIESRSPRRFAQRMWRLLENLEERGVIPLVSEVLPQRRSGDQNRWVHRYNLLLVALTEGRNLPLLRLHDDFRLLPRFGLARDGIHANVYRPDGQSLPCNFGPQGLRYGHNLRNLRTLQHLHRLVKVVRGDSVPMLPGPPAGPNQVSAQAQPFGEPARPLELPYASVGRWESTTPRRYQVELAESAELRVLAIGKVEGQTFEIQVRGDGFERDHRTDWVHRLPAGRYTIDLIPQVNRSGRRATAGEFLLTVEAL